MAHPYGGKITSIEPVSFFDHEIDTPATAHEYSLMFFPLALVWRRHVDLRQQASALCRNR